MTELEQYFRSHAAEFDSETPKEGHEARFLERLDALADASATPAKPTVKWRVVVAALAVAASLAAVWLAVGNRPFLGTGNNPEAIYLAYMDQVAQLYADAPLEDSAAWDQALAQLTEETVPLFEQLPEEMPRAEKARILKQYYGSLLQGAQELANQ